MIYGYPFPLRRGGEEAGFVSFPGFLMCAKVLVLKVEGIGAATFSESYIGLESLYLRWREVWREAQFFQAVKRAM